MGAAAVTKPKPPPVPHTPASLRYSGRENSWTIFEVPSETRHATIYYVGFNATTSETRCTCPGERRSCWHQREVGQAWRIWREEQPLQRLTAMALRQLEARMRAIIATGNANSIQAAIWDAIGNEWCRRGRVALRLVANTDLFGEA